MHELAELCGMQNAFADIEGWQSVSQEQVIERNPDYIVLVTGMGEISRSISFVGPNGAGKSTLIETISQGVPYTGSVQLDGKDIRRFKAAQLARKIGVLSQKTGWDTPITLKK